jgi:Radical SAM superfamily
VGDVVDAGTGVRVVLVSTYDLGHQPFGLASPAAWLRAAGHHVTCVDVSVRPWDAAAVAAADLIAFFVPMHTATRMTCELIPRARRENPAAHLCAYGLYAPVNADLLRGLGVGTLLGGEFEASLTALADGLARDRRAVELPMISLDRLRFRAPDRSDLPPLDAYASLQVPDEADRVVGYTEATRGCKHVCRHCPVVPVYGGKFRVVDAAVVVEDVDRQVDAGARHITFGDPDFLNGPRHAMAVVEQLHARHPGVSYDVTIKVEHLLAHRDLLPALSATGCLMITSAVEAFDERILQLFDKGHTRADVATAVELLRSAGIVLNPTFVAFTPWTSRSVYTDFLVTLHDLGLVGNVSPVQLAIRLLITARSRLLELDEVGGLLSGFDADGLCHRWAHPDPDMDALQDSVFAIVENAADGGSGRAEAFAGVCEVTARTLGGAAARRLDALGEVPVVEVPALSEPWYCCAEPVRRHLEPLL